MLPDDEELNFPKTTNKFYFSLSRDKCFHRRLNIDWLLRNKLLKPDPIPISTKWMKGSNSNGTIAFIGKHN